MGKLGDLFIKLFLKKDDFEEGMEDAKDDVDEFGGKLGKIKAIGVAVWAAIGAGAIKLGKDIVTSTNLMSDAWDQKMSSMKASWHSMMAEISEKSAKQPGFWMRFFNRSGEAAYDVGANAKAAGEAAARMTAAFDAEFELANSVRLQRTAAQQELNELYVAMRNTNLSPEDRKAAADRYRAIIEPIARAEAETYGNMMNVAAEAWQAGTDLDRIYSTDEIVEFFTKVGTQTDAMKEKYADLFRVFTNRKGDTQNKLIFDVIAQWQLANSQMSAVEKELSEVDRALFAEQKAQLKALADWAKGLRIEAAKVEIEPQFEFDTDLENQIDEYADQVTQQLISSIQEKQADVKALNDMLENTFIDAFGGATQAFTDMLMGIEGADASQVLKAVLQPIANTAIQLGEMLIAEGLAISAFKESLKGLRPEVALAAGATLIAVGSALASGIKRMGNGAGTTASTAQGATGGNAEKLEQEITINVVGEISGDKIILAGQKTLNKWAR